MRLAVVNYVAAQFDGVREFGPDLGRLATSNLSPLRMLAITAFSFLWLGRCFELKLK